MKSFVSKYQKRRIAIVGCGEYMYHVLWPAMRGREVELAGICDIDPAKLDRFAAMYQTKLQHEGDRKHLSGYYTNYIEMLETVEPEAVICAVNPAVHFEVAKACLERGIHIFIEKTPCNTYVQAKALAELANKNKLVAMVGFNRRFATGYLMAKELIGDQKKFGEPAMYYSKFNAGPYRSHEYFVTNHIIHHLDLAYYLLGAEIEEINMRFRNVNAAGKAEEATGAFIVDFTTTSGTIGTIQAASLPDEPLPMERLDIVGTSGHEIIVDNLRSLNYYRSGPRRDLQQQPLLENGDILAWQANNGSAYAYHHLGFTEQMDHFLAAIESRMKAGTATDVETVIDCGCSMESCLPVMRDVEKLLAMM